MSFLRLDEASGQERTADFIESFTYLKETVVLEVIFLKYSMEVEHLRCCILGPSFYIIIACELFRLCVDDT